MLDSHDDPLPYAKFGANKLSRNHTAFVFQYAIIWFNFWCNGMLLNKSWDLILQNDVLPA